MRNERGAASTTSIFSKTKSSEQFDKLFKEGMSLVEETANYLDSQGRVDSRALDRPTTIAYATESMRLTTRLMQLASWLLLRRAVTSGEVSQTDAEREKSRVNLNDIGAGNPIPGAENLPEGLVDLVARSLRLHERITVMDQVINNPVVIEAANENPVALQLDQLAQAFARN
jgi:regulator of CtrA degradation